MKKYEIEYAQFTKVIVDAKDADEAKDIAIMMDGEEIAKHDTHDYTIWGIRKIE